MLNATITSVAIFFGLMSLLLFVHFHTHRHLEYLIQNRLIIRLLLLPGITIHELSHLITALLFGHRIHSISVFSMKGHVLGSVEHSYNIRSPIQVVGNGLVGISPLIYGVSVLFVLLYIRPESTLLFSHFLSYVPSRFTFSEPNSFQFNPLKDGIWLYFFIVVSLTMCPSYRDLKNSAPTGFALLCFIGIMYLLQIEFVLKPIQCVAGLLG